MSQSGPTEEEKRQVALGGEWFRLRSERTSRLTDSDWTQFRDSPLTTEQQDAWAAYRKALRDLPTNTTDPTQVAWPTPPS
jgi:hypothetical protein